MQRFETRRAGWAVARIIMTWALVFTGCSETNVEADGAPATVASTPPPAAKQELPPDVPSCGVSVVDGKVRVRATQTPIAVASDKKLTVYPLDADAILVGVKASRASPDAPGDGKLWKVPCSAPDTASVVFEQAGADFGYGALAPDRKRVIFTGTDGVYALSLRDKESKVGPFPPALRLMEVPEPDVGCWLHGDPMARSRSRYLVRGTTPDQKSVAIEHWTPCGYGAVWVGEPLQVSGLGTPDEIRVSPRQVATVAVDSRDRVWVGDAGRCDEPGMLDAQTPGFVYLSRDKAESWMRIQVFAEYGPMPTAAKTILTDAKQAGAAVVLAQTCTYRTGKRGGFLYYTRSLGANWARVPVPEEVGVRVDGGYGLTAVDLVDGDINKLVVWGVDGRAFRTRLGSGNWRPADGVGAPPASGTVVAKVGSFKLIAASDGLQRVAADGTKTYVFPSPETRLTDEVEGQTDGSAENGTTSERAPSQ